MVIAYATGKFAICTQQIRAWQTSPQKLTVKIDRQHLHNNSKKYIYIYIRVNKIMYNYRNNDNRNIIIFQMNFLVKFQKRPLGKHRREVIL